MAVTQDFAETLEDGRRVLRFSGNLTMLRVRKLNQQLKALPADNLTVDLTEVERMDTVGAWLVHKLERDHGAKLVGATEEQQLLIEHVTKSDRPVKVRREYEPPLRLLLAETGMATQIAIRTMVGLLGFFGALIISVSNIVRHPRRFRFNAVVAQFDQVGIRALAIIGLMSFLVGIVIAQQGAVQLRQFGAEVFTINLIGRSAFKELGVLMTAIMVAGRSGSAFAAQLGSMKLNEEVDAMRTIGVSPMEALIFPRVFATVLLMPLLGGTSRPFLGEGDVTPSWSSDGRFILAAVGEGQRPRLEQHIDAFLRSKAGQADEAAVVRRTRRAGVGCGVELDDDPVGRPPGLQVAAARELGRRDVRVDGGRPRSDGAVERVLDRDRKRRGAG